MGNHGIDLYDIWVIFENLKDRCFSGGDNSDKLGVLNPFGPITALNWGCLTPLDPFGNEKAAEFAA